jgi:peptide chain release factor 2
MKILRGRLFALKEQERLLKLKELRGEVIEIGWGSHIRSYVFQPYSMVKDHRTSEETGNVGAVMDGSIINFINAYLSWIL